MRPCPACRSERRRTAPQGTRYTAAGGFIDSATLAICEDCGCWYEYRTKEEAEVEDKGNVGIYTEINM